VFQQQADTRPRTALRTQLRRTLAKFSPTVPSSLPFQGPPVTPLDPTMGYIRLPVPCAPTEPTGTPLQRQAATIQQQFRSSLQPWQRILFGSLRKAGSTNTLLNHLRAANTLILVSDASVQKDGQSGFAWILAHHHATLWRGSGLAPGPAEDMHSGRAEAFGILAASQFLAYYVSCYDVQLPVTTIKCYCDNLGDITTLCTMQTETIPRPNDTTNDDRDVFMAIMAITEHTPKLRYNFHHVKGHQDKNPQHQLTLAEQYNVDCDRYAKEYVQNCPLRSHTWNNPEFAAAKPHLLIEGKVICRRFLPSLRAAAAHPSYWKYLKERLSWTQADVNSTQWEILTSALKSFTSHDQRRIVLFIHDKLPLRTSKFHPHLGSKLCPSCQRIPEDPKHFLECDHPERRRIFEQLRLQLTATSAKFALHPSILTAFWLGLLTIRSAVSYPNITQDLPPELSRTVNHQTRLGWNQLYYGRLSQQWAAAVDALNPTLLLSGRQVITQFLQSVWKYILATWTLRNRHLHQDAGHLSIPDYQQAVRNLYERAHQIPPTACAALFRKPLEYMLEQPPVYL